MPPPSPTELAPAGIPLEESGVDADNALAQVEPTLFDNTDSSRDSDYRSGADSTQDKRYYRSFTFAHISGDGGDPDYLNLAPTGDNAGAPDFRPIAPRIAPGKLLAAGDAVGPDGARLIGIRGKRGEGVFAVVDAADYERLCPFKWYLNTFGYVFRKVPRADGRITARLLHHDILPPRDGFENDHVDRDRLNNRRANLRYATRGQNLRNKAAEGTASGLRGVRPVDDRFEACIYVERKRFPIGFFDTAKEAALAYDAYARRYFDAFAFINFPDGPLWTVEEAEYVKLAQRRQKARASAPTYERIDAFLGTVAAGGSPPCNNSYPANREEVDGARAGRARVLLTQAAEG